jgi:hypothetical protein
MNTASKACFGLVPLPPVLRRVMFLMVGEVLWSGRQDANGVNRTLTDAAIRLQEFRERIVVRGIQAEPFTQQWCIQRRGECEFPAAAA